MEKIKRENYILIQGWMIIDLKLKGNELLIFALIYGFSQDGAGVFKGSLQYLSEWLNCSKECVRNCLNALIKKKYIIKKDRYVNNIKYCEYAVSRGIQESCIPYNNLGGGIQESCMGVSKKVDGGIQKSCTNNKYNNTNNKNNNKTITQSDFEYLWSLYPKKKGSKTAAFKSYEKAVKNGVTKETVETAIKAFIADCKRNNTPDKFIPYGSTWFNQERWNDSYESAAVTEDYEGGENILDELGDFYSDSRGT